MGKRGVYTCSLILLWMSCVTEFAGESIASRDEFVITNSSPLDMFIGDPASGPPMIQQVAGVVAVFIADVILVRIDIYDWVIS